MLLNPYKKLLALLPDAPLLVGVVDYLTGTGAVVVLPDGSRVTVHGTTTAGASVFIRDGRIEGPAPALSAVLIEV